MDFIVKDLNVRPVAVIDLYTSAIWAERYCDTGDFELYMPLNSIYLEYLAIGNYLTLKDADNPESEKAMIIESMQLESRLDTGEKIVLYKGSSLESILKRRVIPTETTLSGTIDVVVHTLLDQNVIFPNNPNSKRKISKFVWGGCLDATTTDYIRSLGEIECQFTGDVLFDAVKSICEKVNLGFKVIFNDVGEFVFYLYYGVDRTINQAERDAVVFSPEYDTLISSRYLNDFSSYRNLAYVTGEENEGSRTQTTAYFEEEEPSGLNRRELYVDANDIRSEYDGEQLTHNEYVNLLKYRGYSELQENYTTTAFDGEIETSIGPKYGKGYFLGDFVSAVNEYGLGSVAQIVEYIRSYDVNGYSAYPSFVMINQ